MNRRSEEPLSRRTKQQCVWDFKGKREAEDERRSALEISLLLLIDVGGGLRSRREGETIFSQGLKEPYGDRQERERQISTKGQIESVYERERKIGPIWHKRFSLYWVNIGCACSCWQKKLCCSVITMVWCDAGRLNNNNNNNNVNSLTQFPLNLKLFLLWFLPVCFVFRWFDCHFCSNYFCFYKWKEEKISKFSYCCFPSPNL